jgi:hypothetical protein
MHHNPESFEHAHMIGDRLDSSSLDSMIHHQLHRSLSCTFYTAFSLMAGFYDIFVFRCMLLVVYRVLLACFEVLVRSRGVLREDTIRRRLRGFRETSVFSRSDVMQVLTWHWDRHYEVLGMSLLGCRYLVILMIEHESKQIIYFVESIDLCSNYGIRNSGRVERGVTWKFWIRVASANTEALRFGSIMHPIIV